MRMATTTNRETQPKGIWRMLTFHTSLGLSKYPPTCINTWKATRQHSHALPCRKAERLELLVHNVLDNWTEPWYDELDGILPGRHFLPCIHGNTSY